MKKRSPSPLTLQIESLESRQLLTAAVCEVSLPAPPPIEINAEVISQYANHIRARDEEGGVFRALEQRTTAQNGRAVPFVPGDFNGDGVTDLLSEDDAGDWWLYLNDGSRLYELPAGSGPGEVEQLATADFNADGQLDLVSYDPTGELVVSLNRQGSFDQEVWGEFWNPREWSDFHVGDFNGDGRPDVLGGEAGGYWWLAQNNQGTDFDNYRWGNYPDFDWLNVLSGEFTGDGISDIVARAPDNTWWLWEGSTNGLLQPAYFGHWKMRDAYADVQVGDFNGDGTDEVIGRSSDGRLWVGTPMFGQLNTWSWTNGWMESANWSQVTIMDLNGDGRDDQVAHAADDTWWYALSNGHRFWNAFWQKGDAGDFVVQGFKVAEPVDLIDSLPAGGMDTRNTQLTASLDANNRIVITPNQPTEITSLLLLSSRGNLVIDELTSSAPFESLDNATTTSVELSNRQQNPIVITGPLTLDVGWAGGFPDLTITATLGGTTYLSLPVDVPNSMGPASSRQVTAVDHNRNYYDSIPLSHFDLVEQEFTASDVESSDFYAGGYLDVSDGRLTLNGSFPGLAGMDIRSKGGYLSLETVELAIGYEVPIADPFNPADGVIVVNSPHQITIGVLGANKQVYLEGVNNTSALYSGSLETALGGDLTVEIGVGRNTGAQLLHVGKPTASQPADNQ